MAKYTKKKLEAYLEKEFERMNIQLKDLNDTKKIRELDKNEERSAYEIFAQQEIIADVLEKLDG